MATCIATVIMSPTTYLRRYPFITKERKPSRENRVTGRGGSSLFTTSPTRAVLPPFPASPHTPAIIMLSVCRFCQGVFRASAIYLRVLYSWDCEVARSWKASGSQFITQCYRVIECRLIYDYRCYIVGGTVAFVTGLESDGK